MLLIPDNINDLLDLIEFHFKEKIKEKDFWKTNEVLEIHEKALNYALIDYLNTFEDER